jgi:hypothetical protein
MPARRGQNTPKPLERDIWILNYHPIGVVLVSAASKAEAKTQAAIQPNFVSAYVLYL